MNLIRYLPEIAEFDIPSGAYEGFRHPKTPIAGEPRINAVVSCRFPESDKPLRPAEKARPCLIVETKQSQSGLWWVAVIYGTTKHLDEEANAILITDPAETKTAGVDEPTKFRLARHRVLPYLHGFFRADRDGCPQLGELPERCRSLVDRTFGRFATVKKRSFRLDSPPSRPAAVRSTRGVR